MLIENAFIFGRKFLLIVKINEKLFKIAFLCGYLFSHILKNLIFTFFAAKLIHNNKTYSDIKAECRSKKSKNKE